MAKFRCPKTDKEFTITEYSLKFVDGKKIYADKWGKEIVNPDNNEPLEYIEQNKGFCTTVLGSKAERYKGMQDHLKQRAKDHYQSDVRGDKKARGDRLGTYKSLGATKKDKK